ncbi:hypothetical protein D3C87_170530 [compost metagenome]
MKKLVVLSFAFLTLAACSSDDNSKIDPVVPPSSGSIFGTVEHPIALGGPNQGNQVYIDLSGETAAPVARDSWDLGFYSGNKFGVVINGSLMMATKQLATTDLSIVQESDPSVAVGTFQASNLDFVDNPNGKLVANGSERGAAFGTIATSEAAAKVFLINLGKTVPTVAPAPGSTNVAGDDRGWKKAKVWQDGAGYKMKYADLAATANFTEVTIAKDAAYNHVFFSFKTGTPVKVEPLKTNWDLNFTTFTNEVFDTSGISAGAYFYGDFAVINTKAGVTAVKIEGDAAAYEAFNLASVTSGNYTFSDDQRAIGANWRDVLTRVVFSNVFFVLKDAEGNMYKIKFISMLNTTGERGYPVFQYEILK